MKKQILTSAVGILAALGLAGCGKDASAPVSSVSESIVSDADTGEIKLPTDSAAEVAEEMTADTVDSFIQLAAYKGLNIEAPGDTEIAEGMTVNIDYIGKQNGETFDGSSDTDFDVFVGSGSMPGDFETKLLGHKAGDKFKIKVKMPDYYASDDLAGKEVTYAVKINRVYHMPPDMACMQFVDSCKVLQYPSSLIEELRQDYLKTYGADPAGKADQGRVDEAAVLKKLGFSEETFRDILYGMAKEHLVCSAVMQKEGITKEDPVYLACLKEALGQYEFTSLDEAAENGFSTLEIEKAAQLRLIQDLIVKYQKA